MTTTAELTEKYLSQHPSLLDCLKNGVINYSKLSRKIAKELRIENKTSIDAILIACRRYEAKLGNEKLLEDQILKILKESELEIKNKIIVLIVEKSKYFDKIINIEERIQEKADLFYAIEGSKVFTIIASEKNQDKIFGSSTEGILKITKDLAMITIKSPEEMESTPGVTSFILSLFGQHGINIYETMSCWTDTIIVISEKDIAKVMTFLKF